LRRIKTIGHVIGRIHPWINGRNAQQALAEFQQADVRVLHPRNKAFTCIRTNQETRDAGAVAKRDLSTPSLHESLGPSIFAAIEQQLGLKLELQKVPTEFLVIDHAEKPSEN
jgi:uncharacterized protein (TIGR03435 family)